MPDEVRELAPEIPWKTIAGLRNLMAHRYYEIRPGAVWKMALENVPEPEPKILAIDYDHMRMVVHSALPKMPRHWHRTKLFVKQGSTFITGKLKIGRLVYRDTFMFHTGYGGAVLLGPKIGERYEMQSTLPTLGTSELKDAYGNVFKIETKSLPQLQVGGVSGTVPPTTNVWQSSFPRGSSQDMARTLKISGSERIKILGNFIFGNTVFDVVMHCVTSCGKSGQLKGMNHSHSGGGSGHGLGTHSLKPMLHLPS